MKLFVLKSPRIPMDSFFVEHPRIKRDKTVFISLYEDLPKMLACGPGNRYMIWHEYGEADRKLYYEFKARVKRLGMKLLDAHYVTMEERRELLHPITQDDLDACGEVVFGLTEAESAELRTYEAMKLTDLKKYKGKYARYMWLRGIAISGLSRDLKK